MKILHLVLKYKWYDMIDSGVKLEEYRYIKPYWSDRLDNCDENGLHYEAVRFQRGYTKNPPTMTFKWDEELVTGEGRPEWGAEPGKKYFVIKLGERLKAKDLTV
jgi:hypothetical protein